MGNSVLKKVEWLTWRNPHAHQSKLILVSLGQHHTRGGGLVGGRVSPPYTDDFEFLFFFFVVFVFFWGGGGQRIQYVITISVFSPAHCTVNHAVFLVVQRI